MAQDKAFAFDPLDQFTVVVVTPAGVEVSQAKYSELDSLTVPEVGPGISVEVIPPLREDGTARDGVYLEEGQSVKDVAERVTKNENRRRKAAAEPEAEAAEAARPAEGPSAERVAEKPQKAEAIEPQPAREAAVKPETRTGAKAAFGPVGPDPKQEAARSRSVAGPTAPTGPTGVTGPTGRRR